MIALSFALPEESKDLLRRIENRKRSGLSRLPVFTGSLAGHEVAILHTGMGMDSATARAGEFLASHTPRLWIAAGFGGALASDLGIGDIVTASNFSDPALLERIASLPARTGQLITIRHALETAAGKRSLGHHTGALAVDMETAAVHRLCAARPIPMLAVRAISDTASDDLPVPSAIWFDLRRQQPRPARLVAYLALHPGRIAPFARFVGGLSPARACLTDYLCQAISLV